MSTTCMVVNCSNDTSMKLGHYEIPNPDENPEMVKQWLHRTGNSHLSLGDVVIGRKYNIFLVCEIHFKPEDFESKKLRGRQILKDCAIPSVHLENTRCAIQVMKKVKQEPLHDNLLLKALSSSKPSIQSGITIKTENSGPMDITNIKTEPFEDEMQLSPDAIAYVESKFEYEDDMQFKSVFVDDIQIKTEIVDNLPIEVKQEIPGGTVNNTFETMTKIISATTSDLETAVKTGPRTKMNGYLLCAGCCVQLKVGCKPSRIVSRLPNINLWEISKHESNKPIARSRAKKNVDRIVKDYEKEKQLSLCEKCYRYYTKRKRDFLLARNQSIIKINGVIHNKCATCHVLLQTAGKKKECAFKVFGFTIWRFSSNGHILQTPSLIQIVPVHGKDRTTMFCLRCFNSHLEESQNIKSLLEYSKSLYSDPLFHTIRSRLSYRPPEDEHRVEPDLYFAHRRRLLRVKTELVTDQFKNWLKDIMTDNLSDAESIPESKKLNDYGLKYILKSLRSKSEGLISNFNKSNYNIPVSYFVVGSKTLAEVEMTEDVVGSKTLEEVEMTENNVDSKSLGEVEMTDD